jgi:hypothetical protein
MPERLSEMLNFCVFKRPAFVRRAISTREQYLLLKCSREEASITSVERLFAGLITFRDISNFSSVSATIVSALAFINARASRAVTSALKSRRNSARNS